MKPKSPVKVNPRPFKLYVLIALGLLLLAVILYTSTGKKHTDRAANTSATDSSVQRGMVLALQNCGSCHMLPEPSLIDKASWENVLPKMGLRLGINYHDGTSYQSTDPAAAAEEAAILPANPALTDNQWQDILNYYLTSAPDALPLSPGASGQPGLTSFSEVLPAEKGFKQRSMITFVKIDNSVKPARIFAFELYSSRLVLLNSKLELLDAIHMDGIIVDMTFHKGAILAVSMGPRMNLRDSEKTGRIIPLTVSSSGKMKSGSPMFENLARPLQILPADLNGDGLEDYLICEFGHLTGMLSWMENKGNNVFSKHILRNLPGSIKAIPRKNKATGKTDIWVLFGQGEEGIFRFVNKGEGKFEEKEVLRFPPVYGSSSFQMIDMDKDGFEDIVYTCGDNGDYSKILKPYHGVYIYRNDGRDNFGQVYFYPLNGCYKAIAEDFTGSGKIDLAVISFFTNPTRPGHSFVYLKNSGSFSYQPELITQSHQFESLLTMDAGDSDNDGRTDILLGNGFPFPGIPVSAKTEPMLMILKNNAK